VLHLLVLHWGVWRVPLWANVGIVTKLSALEASSSAGVQRYYGHHECANWSPSADSSGKLGVESEEQDAETAEQTAGTAEQDVGTAAVRSVHPVPQNGTGCSAVG
jgi:hypothetical protein